MAPRGGGKTVRHVLALVLAALLALAGCSRGPAPATLAPATQAPPQSQTPPPPPPKEVLIGAVYPLSGALAAAGQDARRGLDLAAQVVNGKYALDLPLARDAGLPALGGARLRLAYEDSQGDPARAAASAERLISQEHAAALVGAYTSAGTAMASEVAERHGVPFLSPDVTAPLLTGRGYRWFFRTAPAEDTLVQGCFSYLGGPRGGADRLALVFEAGRFDGAAEAVRALAVRDGYHLVLEEPYAAASPDLNAEAQAVAEAHPAVLFQAADPSGAALLTQSLAGLHFQPKERLALGDAFADPAYLKSAGDAASGTLACTSFAPDLGRSKPLVAQVGDLYRSRYGVELDGTAAQAFLGLLVLADAVQRAAADSPDAVRRALESTRLPAAQVPLPWGGVQFDASGQNTLARGIVAQLREGRYVTVWPADLAAGPAAPRP